MIALINYELLVVHVLGIIAGLGCFEGHCMHVCLYLNVNVVGLVEVIINFIVVPDPCKHGPKAIIIAKSARCFQVAYQYQVLIKSKIYKHNKQSHCTTKSLGTCIINIQLHACLHNSYHLHGEVAA